MDEDQGSGKKVMVVGGGARENALADAVVAGGGRVFAFMPFLNPGIKRAAEAFEIGGVDDLDSAVSFARKHGVDFAVIGPETALAAGIVDELEKNGFGCIGPGKKLARLETSKGFARSLLKKYNIRASPEFRIFEKFDEQEINSFLDHLKEFAVKPDGLTGGKGVKLSGEHLKNKEDALDYCSMLLEKGNIVIEEKLDGEEFSLQTLTDGKGFLHFPPVQDHKRAFEGDSGPNTGGMGSYSDSDFLLPFLTAEDLLSARRITEQAASAIKQEAGPYRGVMYGGFIKTSEGVKLIEYNARFGDPEAMNVLPLLKTSFVSICESVLEGSLGSLKAEFLRKASVCKYVVPKGYPDSPEKGSVLVPKTDALTYYASVEETGGGILTTGSRSVAFVGIADTIEESEQIAERAACQVEGPVFHRKDIGTKELVQKRISHVRKLGSFKGASC